MNDPQDILAFWFGEPAADAAELQRKFQRWFVVNPDFDREIIARFSGDVERALAGELPSWRGEPRTRLALIVLLDQFTRTLFRGQARTFAGDPMAQELGIEAIDRGWHREVSLEERQFYIMPLMHAEDLALQRRANQLAHELVAEAPPELRGVFGMTPEQSGKYIDLIARFGRFPFRNEALGRASSEAELEFLRDWKQRQHPTGMQTKK
jgi:uncharacterized protein (DUF924 family)